MKDKRNPGAIDYFNRKIRAFDDIYRDDKKGLLSILNRVIRASVRIRFDLAFDILGDLTGRSVLDIGCGSGRYMFKALERNAGYVVGIDAAAGALEQAQKMAEGFNLKDRLKFVESDFMDFSSDRKFDVIFAVGYFDYIFNPLDHLRKMIDLSDGLLFASFPKMWSVFTVTRKMRLALNRCPVRFYTKPRIERFLRELGVGDYELRTVFRDYILIVRK
ncbi:MAG: class I SAM-dependent methyltransferase [Candidatus Zixiibacteriota bacterium]|nr:MAG: class I SAM-dependent methyltransferase [candidate division Zixibacteria bacterium]